MRGICVGLRSLRTRCHWTALARKTRLTRVSIGCSRRWLERLVGCVRDGDEFTVILNGIRGGANAARVAQEMVEAAASPRIIGIYPNDALELEVLLARANTAMYEAKAAGRNRLALARQASAMRAQCACASLIADPALSTTSLYEACWRAFRGGCTRPAAAAYCRADRALRGTRAASGEW